MQTQQTSLSDHKGANCAACGNVRRVRARRRVAQAGTLGRNFPDIQALRGSMDVAAARVERSSARGRAATADGWRLLAMGL